MEGDVAALPLIEGRIELIDNGVVHGWAWCPDDPSERVELEVLLDGEPVGTVLADLERPNLAAAGYGDGAYGFRVELPVPGDPVAGHVICMRRGAHRALPASAFTVRASDEGPWSGVRFRVDYEEFSWAQPPLEGRVEAIGDGVVEGWAWIPTMPSSRTPLTLWIDGEEIAHAPAELPRPSLAAAGIGDGAHAFRFALPEALAHPGERRVRVESFGEPVPAAGELEIVGVARSDDPWYGARFTLDSTPPKQTVDAVRAVGDAPPAPPPVPSVPVLGRGGWLFDGALIRPRAEAERIAYLESQVAALVERLDLLSERLGEQGVKLLPVLMPSKEHVYAERLPPWGEASVAIRPGDLIQRGLFGHPTLEPLDLLPALRAGADEWLVYAPFRQAPTDWGTYCAYRAVIKRLAWILPGIPPPLELAAGAITGVRARRLHREALVARRGHLVAEVLDDPGVIPDEPVITIPPGSVELTRPEHLARLHTTLAIGWEQGERRELARALIVGSLDDTALVAWVARHLRFTVLVGHDAPLVDLVALERPDAIVYLIDEVGLMAPPPGEERDPAEADAVVAPPPVIAVAGNGGSAAVEFRATTDPPPGVCGFCGNRERADFGGREAVLCLGCASLERHRALLGAIGEDAMRGAGRRAIEIAPLNEIVFGDTLRGWGWDYMGIDQSRMGSAHDPRQVGFIDYEADVRKLDRIADDSVDLIILQCVLEEVPDVDAALAELARVLAPTGRAFLEIPFNPRIPTSTTQPPDHFGDVWKFGADLPDRVRRYFPVVDVIGHEEGAYFGRVCVCRGAA